MTRRGLTAAVAAIAAPLVFAAIALAAPPAGKWEGTTSQDDRAFSFKVTQEAVVKNIVFETRANCTSKSGQKWHPEFVTKSYKGTKGTVKNGEIHIVRDLPEQKYELHGKFKKGKANGRIEWKFWTKADGKFAYKKKDRVWTCKSNFDWSVTKPD
jgi:hypothetical protein